jgi:hypothetical protein
MTVCCVLRIAAVALTVAATWRAQSPPCEQRTVIASVLGDNGLPLRGLTAQNFTGELRGKPIKVASVTALSEPRKIVVVLDGSEGMRDADSGKWAMAQAVVGHIVENGPRDAEYTVAIAGTEEKRLVRGHAMEPIFLNKFSDLFQGIPMATHKARRAPIFDVIQGGLALLENSEPGDVVFLVTDGGEESSRVKARDIQRELVVRGVRLFAVTLPMRYERQVSVIRPGSGDTSYDEIAEATDFLETARISGGGILRILPKKGNNEWSFKFTDEQRIAVATSLQRLYLQMMHAYRLELAPGAPVERSTTWKLKVTSPGEVPSKSLRVAHPTYIYPCEQKP